MEGIKKNIEREREKEKVGIKKPTVINLELECEDAINLNPCLLKKWPT
jgi:hypothetical protein